VTGAEILFLRCTQPRRFLQTTKEGELLSGIRENHHAYEPGAGSSRNCVEVIGAAPLPDAATEGAMTLNSPSRKSSRS